MDQKNQEYCHCRIIHTERVENARRTALSDMEQQRLTNTYKAMGDSTRLKILLALAHEEMCVCDLAAFLDISESAVSHQLRMLRQLYLVISRREGQILYYNLNDDHIRKLLAVGIEHIRE
ncbi:MAG: metalloregulator ArsR/SmtB family transcription factor [Proteobacteria bacterium]|nr:metalloregulator ArsR/SmtB family transcription factor [Pseudomonadota bacterium]MBU1737300.1 metalloregulator ArsR/SmtB family transcription factor [Pseudomonadota bacterium]